jgi:arsenate reductase-like glutaredoxin family protein
VKFHCVAILEKGMSKGELTSVLAAVKDIDLLANPKSAEYHLFRHLTPEGKFDKLSDCPALIQTPVVRSGKLATVGYCPKVWEEWMGRA